MTFGKGDDGDAERGVAYVDEGDVFGAVGFGEVGFGDTVAESGGGGVVDESEDVEARDRGGIVDRASLNVREPAGNGDDDIRNAGFEFCAGCVADATKIHGYELC